MRASRAALSSAEREGIDSVQLQPWLRLRETEVDVPLRGLQVAAQLTQPAAQPKAAPPGRVGAPRADHSGQRAA